MHHSPAQARATDQSTDNELESLFDRFAWIYAFYREHVFRDDTEQIVHALWFEGIPPTGSQLLELACGPGFYACRLAECFTHLQVTGIDRAERQLCRARSRAAARRLANCHFEQADVLALPQSNDAVDAVVASRLFLILGDRERALAEMYRVLRPGGRCFIAEPRTTLRATAPLHTLWLLARLSALCANRSSAYREPSQAVVLPFAEFGALIKSQPWTRVWCWHDTRYQYAVCEKGTKRSMAMGSHT